MCVLVHALGNCLGVIATAYRFYHGLISTYYKPCIATGSINTCFIKYPKLYISPCAGKLNKMRRKEEIFLLQNQTIEVRRRFFVR